MTHGPMTDKLRNEKLDFVKEHRRRWYNDDERRYASVDRHVDDQIKRINRRAAKPGPFKPFRPSEPDGINAAERGR